MLWVDEGGCGQRKVRFYPCLEIVDIFVTLGKEKKLSSKVIFSIINILFRMTEQFRSDNCLIYYPLSYTSSKTIPLLSTCSDLAVLHVNNQNISFINN